MPSFTSSDRQEIILLCELHEEANWQRLKSGYTTNHKRCIAYKSYFIKYGSHDSLYFQCETQKYIHKMTTNDSSAPRVPEVLDYFTDGWSSYLVMEFIEGTTPAVCAYENVADVLQWLSEVPVPPDVEIGSVGGGPARHRLFKDFEAPLLFSSKRALEAYMNRALKCIPKACRPSRLSFTNDKVFFMLSDMHESNFLLDGNGNLKVCMVDFKNVVLLPESFASFNMNADGNTFIEKVAGCLDWARSPNGYTMARAGSILCMTSDATFGLDKNGHKRASR